MIQQSAPPAVGVLPVARFALADLGSGMQITGLWANGVYVRFLSGPLWRIELNAPNTDPRVAPLLPAALPAPVVHAGATSFSIVWTSASLASVEVRGRITPFGSLALDASAALGSSLAATYTSWSLKLPDLLVEPLDTANRSRFQWIDTTAGGQIIHDIVHVPVDTHGYTAPYPSAVPEPLALAGRLPTSDQFVGLWQQNQDRGLWIFAADPGACYKDFGFKGDGTNVNVFVRHLNPNNFEATSQTLQYETHLLPLTGGYHEFLRVREQILNAVLPESWALTPPIREFTGSLPDSIRNARLCFYVNLPYDGTRSDYIARMRTDILRALAKTAYKGRVLVYVNGWEATRGDGDYPDNYYPPSTEVKDFVRDIHDAGARVFPYFRPHFVNPDGAWFTGGGSPGLTDPEDLTVQKAGGADAVDSIAGKDHVVMDFALADARAQVSDIIARVQDELHNQTHAAGAYADLINAPWGSFRSALGLALKGLGSASHYRGSRVFLLEMIARMRVKCPGFAFWSEWADAGMADVFALSGIWFYNADYPYTYLPVYQTLALDRQRFMHFSTPPSINAADNPLLLDLGKTLNAFFFLGSWHYGAIPTLHCPGLPQFLPWFLQSGEPSFAAWTAYQKPVLDLIEATQSAHDWPVGGLGPYRGGRRLKRLTGTWEHFAESTSYIEAAAYFAAHFALAGPGVMAHAVLNLDDGTGAIGILAHNYLGTGPVAWTISMPRAEYHELGSGEVILVRNVGGVRTKLAAFFGDISFDVTLSPWAFNLFEILKA